MSPASEGGRAFLSGLEGGGARLIVRGHGRPRADGARSGVMPLSSAVLAAKEDYLQVEVVPEGLGKQRLEVPLCLFHVLAVREAPALGEAVDMRVDRERRDAEDLRHHDAGGLVADSGQSLELPEALWDLPAMQLEQHVCCAVEVVCLCVGEPDGFDCLLDGLDVEGGHPLSVRGHLEES